MTGPELVQHFDKYSSHLRGCDRHMTKALGVYMNNGYQEPDCTCGLADVREELGLPKEDDAFLKNPEGKGRPPDASKFKKMANVMPGLRTRDECTHCGRRNSVEQVELTDEGVLCRFQCVCGNEHGIVHTGRTVDAYKVWLEQTNKEGDAEVEDTSVQQPN